MRNERIVIFVPSVNCQLENRSTCAVSVHLCRGFFYRHGKKYRIFPGDYVLPGKILTTLAVLMESNGQDSDLVLGDGYLLVLEC